MLRPVRMSAPSESTWLNLNDNGTTVRVCNQPIAESINGSRLVQHGDSGGPVWTSLGLPDGNTASAVGIISGGNADDGQNGAFVNFTQMPDMLSKFGAYIQTAYPH
ncbi:hypothetical protein ABT297_01070 [Dactylosporangium sp. NPDC000555]|uniref:hypothetical protein n=1 Tax=Dactylosporangium sp. NPDC000555 TaxID=3154260 RepID=UPI003330FA76